MNKNEGKMAVRTTMDLDSENLFLDHRKLYILNLHLKINVFMRISVFII